MYVCAYMNNLKRIMGLPMMPAFAWGSILVIFSKLFQDGMSYVTAVSYRAVNVTKLAYT